MWLQTFPGLATSDVEGFRSAIGELGPWCAELRLRSASNPVVFSLTGGFKAMQGVLQALGTLYADRTVYLFEAEGSPLLSIPRVPASLDLVKPVLANSQQFRWLGAGGDLPVTECRGIPETMLDIVGERATLGLLWGQAAWHEARSKVLGEPDLPPLTARLTRDPDVVRWLKAEPGATVAVNAAVDELEILLDRHNGNVDAAERGSLRLHRVQGIDGVWEFYPFAGNDSRRAFGFVSSDGAFCVALLRSHLPNGTLPPDVRALAARART